MFITGYVLERNAERLTINTVIVVEIGFGELCANNLLLSEEGNITGLGNTYTDNNFSGTTGTGS